MSSIEALLKLGNARGPGPAATYGPSQLLIVLMKIGESGSIGRHNLATEAGLGDGAVRTVIKWLKEGGYIGTKAEGCFLTRKGELAYLELKRTVPRYLELSEAPLAVGRRQVAVVVRRRSGRVRSGIEQRDSSIKAGADGATTYVVEGSKFQVPGSSRDAAKDFPSPAWAELRSGLKPASGDVVIVCGSDSVQRSLVGAMSAALTLLS